MKRYIIACRFNHAFVCRTWVSKAKARPGRRYGIAKNWRSLEASAIAEVEQRAGAWPVQGFYPCTPDLAGGAVYLMRGFPRTRAKRLYAELEASIQQYTPRPIEAGAVEIIAVRYGRHMSYQLFKLTTDTPGGWVRAENWRELRAAALAAFLAHYGDAPPQEDTSIACPPDLAARAIWPGE